ncbi:ATP-binding protein [Candidatus Roizmanbacteria bacterium]|nr:ATP-binding protein [Candidatus Roizmanbacteria bacterium]
MKYIKRDIEEQMSSFFKLPQIIAIIGPRRSGKTTLLLHLKQQLKNSLYLSFEDQKILDIFDTDIDTFAKLYLENNKYLIIDEFHYSKKGGKNLKYLFDFFPNTKILISGSSALELTVKAIKFLVGRVVVFQLLPFSFSEFLKVKNKKLYEIYQNWNSSKANNKIINQWTALNDKFDNYVSEYMLFGGYPEVVIQNNKEIKKTLLTQIYSLYFLKEVKDILGLIDDYKLRQLIKALSLQIGNICQYNELAQLSSFSQPTVKKYLNFLEKSFITFFIRPYFKNKRTELVKNPKVYFFDTGLRNSILDNFLPLDKRGDKGAIIENFVAQHLIKDKAIYYWRTKSKAEVDFIMEKEGEVIPVEVKSALSKPVINASLSSFMKKYQPKRGFVLSTNLWSRKKVGRTTVNFLPIILWEKVFQEEK